MQFKRNSEALGIRNSELASINAVTREGVELLTDENKIVQLQHGAKELQHLDHGYVLTTYASQGKDKKRGLGLIESFNRFAATIQNYYVETTRGISEMTVVTDNKVNLVRAITTNDSDKYSSIEMVGSDTLITHQARFQESKHSMALQNAIEKKLTKEQDWGVLEHTVERYASAKQQGHERVAAKIAFSIVHEPKVYRLAQERLGFKTNTYRRDALKFETAKFFHALSPEERGYFSTVRQYVAFNQQIVKRLEHTKIVSPLPKSNENSMLMKERTVRQHDVNLNQRHIQQLTMQRNQLARLISDNLEGYKPYLTHFSIGELNRIGLPQYEFGSESKKAETRLENLARHAATDHVRENISAYLSAQGEKREILASQIRREAKLSHPFVIEFGNALGQQPGSLWKGIYQDARAQSDRLFRNGLNGDGRQAFDKAKAYKKLQVEIRASWAESLKSQEGVTESQSKDLLTLRNALAHQLMHNKSSPEVLAYFNLDSASLLPQNEKHRYHENVQRYMESKGNFKERLGVINEIKNDVKGHYPFIKEAGIDTKILSKFMRVTDRMERLEGFSGVEQDDYKRFLAYKHSSREAYKAWQIVHQDKSKNQKSAAISQAITHSSKRDFLASILEKSLYLDTILSAEKGNKEKLLTHASHHTLNVQEVSTMNTLLQTLSKQYSAITSKTTKEITAWKRNWTGLNQQLQRMEKGERYQFALKENPLNLSVAEKIRHELQQSGSENLRPLNQEDTKLLSPSLRQLQKSSQYIDAKVVNESLMANPEETYRAIWGEPKSNNSKELRYSGGLIVTLKGRDSGLWHDFTEGVGGAPIQAIMKDRNVSFQEALKIAADLAGIYEFGGQLKGVKKDMTANVEKIHSDTLERKNKILSAKSIWNSAIDAKGTLAEKYLMTHRGINKIDELEIRFWPKGASWKNPNELGILEEKVNQIPALIFAARNEKGELTGVQRIYLDADTAKKNTFMENAKLSKGIMEGSCGIIQKGMRGSRLYIVEGPETAASIAMADSKATVIVSYGISNMKNLAPIIKTYHAKDIIIAGDNDGDFSKTQQQIEKTIEHYKKNDISARAIFPESLSGLNKTDWNDVLLKKGVGEIGRQLFGNEFKNSELKFVNQINVPDAISRSEHHKLMKLDDINIHAIRDVVSIINKEKNVNQLKPSYQKVAIVGERNYDTNKEIELDRC